MTESGMEEFIVAIKGRSIKLLERHSADSKWVFRSTAFDSPEWEVWGYKIVKVYFPDVGQLAWYCDRYATILDAEIGYHEQRLSALERLSLRVYVTCYWDIPF